MVLLRLIVIPNNNNLTNLEILIFGLSIIMGLSVGLSLGVYSFLINDLLFGLFFILIFIFSVGLFIYVNKKTKNIKFY